MSRKLITNTFVSLDGVMQAPGGPDEDPSGGFELGGWMVGYSDESTRETLDSIAAAGFDLLLGRKTYDIFASYWPQVSDNPMGDSINNATKYVASNTLTDPSWEDTVVFSGDVAGQIGELKQTDGPDLLVYGSGNLIQTLLEHRLIDESKVWIFPLVLGGGKRLFGEGAAPTGLELTDMVQSTTGVLIATYRPAGSIKLGSVDDRSNDE